MSSAYALGFTGLQQFARKSNNWLFTYNPAPGYGPLVADPAGILDLPAGFAYQILSTKRDFMDDGFRVPGAPDGMATFPGPNNLTILVRNHEVNTTSPRSEGPFGSTNEYLHRLRRTELYDPGRTGKPALGGTTTLVYDTQNQQLVRQFLSLAGTLRNCAGGPTPWNSWVTCEETTQKANATWDQDHGYVFEVPATAEPGRATPTPIRGMGRFNHEAIAVDPVSGVVYLTEDRGDGLIYRYIPNVPGQLRQGGTLQALKVTGQPSLDTRNHTTQDIVPGTVMNVEWIALSDIQSPNDDLRIRGFNDGAAKFSRGEGMWYGQSAVFFACTDGGTARKGQIWKYTPSPDEGTPDESLNPGQLELFVEPNDGTIIENADNLTVAPWGDLIVCEDGSGDDYLVGITPTGDFYKLAHNVTNNSELTGVTFSPDGSTLFVNIQSTGQTFAVTGPW